ncbi:hypothetical protein CR513_60384, partial [Mucuna pruriens]
FDHDLFSFINNTCYPLSKFQKLFILAETNDNCLHALSLMAVLFSNLGITNTKSFFSFTSKPIICGAKNVTSKRNLILQTSLLCIGIGLTPQVPVAQSSPQPSPSKSLLSSIEDTKSWFQFYGDGFAIRVPPEFKDIMEPEDFNAGQSLYGDKAKEKTFSARFASSDGSEILSVITRPTNQLKITFLQAQNITDLGSLKEAARIFVPGGATLYSARSIKIKEDEGFATYYFYEFGKDEQHVALMTGVSSGKAFIAGATAPQSKWDSDGVKLRSAAISLKILKSQLAMKAIDLIMLFFPPDLKQFSTCHLHDWSNLHTRLIVCSAAWLKSRTLNQYSVECCEATAFTDY